MRRGGVQAYIYADDGITGAEFLNRPGFVRLMNELKPRAPFHILIISELSRLGREQLETGYALKQLSQAGVRVFSYLEDREILLQTPTDKFLLSAMNFAAEVEREKARQRTSDAMVRKARAGHVTGGRVFGYDNFEVLGPAGQRSHTERRINPSESAVVRRIFEMCAAGVGKIRIAKTLNAAGAPTPRPQQGRPSGWCPSSIRDVLYRELYRGVIVYNKTAKRNTWGLRKPTDRPEQEWIRVPVPALTIVTDELWVSAHARLSLTRAAYLHRTKGRVWGRPVSGVDSKYLLTGLASCGCCGGALEIRSRDHGRQREYYYGCRAHWRLGPSVCRNGFEISMDVADAAVLEAVEDEFLDHDVVQDVVAGVIAEVLPAGEALETKRATLQRELRNLNTKLQRFSAAIAIGGNLTTLVAAIRDQEQERDRVERQLDVLAGQVELSAKGRDALDLKVRSLLADWRGVLRKHVPEARQIVSKLLHGRLAITPERRGNVNGFRLRGVGTFMKFLEGLLTSQQPVASPAGLERCCGPDFTRVLRAA